MSYKIPIGPFHPALEAPYKIGSYKTSQALIVIPILQYSNTPILQFSITPERNNLRQSHLSLTRTLRIRFSILE